MSCLRPSSACDRKKRRIREERWREEENQKRDVARVDGYSLLPLNEFHSSTDWGGLTLMPHVQKQACTLFVVRTHVLQCYIKANRGRSMLGQMVVYREKGLKKEEEEGKICIIVR